MDPIERNLFFSSPAAKGQKESGHIRPRVGIFCKRMGAQKPLFDSQLGSFLRRHVVGST